jgi:hypothetical protein
MSTRCQIGFYEKPGQPLKKPSALIYRHWDGYPEGVLPEILPYCVRFEKLRGMGDTEHLAARLLGHLLDRGDPDDVLGYGISADFHGDLEFYYAVFGNGIIKVYAVRYDAKKNWAIRFQQLAQIDIKDVPEEPAPGDYLYFYQRVGGDEGKAA